MSIKLQLHTNVTNCFFFSLVVRCQSCPPSATDREELLVKKAKEFYYRHRGSFSGAVSMAKDRNSSLLIESHRR